MLAYNQLAYIAEQYKTPAYIFDIEELTQRMQSIREIAGEDIGLCFAMKANPFLVHYIKPFVDRLEVCSPGEFAICERENLNMQSIVLSGVYKNSNDIEYTMQLQNSIGRYTVESMQQWELLAECSKKMKKKYQYCCVLQAEISLAWMRQIFIGLFLQKRSIHMLI